MNVWIPAVCCLILIPAAGSSAAVAAPSRAPLERFLPLLRYDSAETHYAQPVSRNGEVIEADVVYGREAVERGERWLQYWLFYAYNGQDRGVFRTGRHEGDWEFVQLRLDMNGVPDAATFAQHSWAEACSFGELEFAERGAVQVPVVYVANGSHASYPRSGTADRPWPDPNDQADGGGREVRPRLVRIGEGTSWVHDSRPWGSSRAGMIPGEQSSPKGPLFATDDRWRQPATYHGEVARECGEGPPGRPWQTAAILALGLGIGVLLWFRRSRAAA